MLNKTPAGPGRPTRAALTTALWLCMAGAAHAEERELVIDVSGIESFGILGDTRNPTFSWYLGPNAEITGIDWDVEIEAAAPAMLYQAAVYFGHSERRQLGINPGFGDEASGIKRFTDRIGSLTEEGLGFTLKEDGLLKATFFSQWDYDNGLPVNTWKSGTITLVYEVAAVPEPESYALMAAGLLLVAARRASRRAGG
jgi:PEP-CTERM motif